MRCTSITPLLETVPVSTLPIRYFDITHTGVTRPDWGDEKKKKYIGAADIPIVRLNPLNILGVKCQSEQALRDSGARYCIVRPCGLNDKWPTGRPVLSQVTSPKCIFSDTFPDVQPTYQFMYFILSHIC